MGDSLMLLGDTMVEGKTFGDAEPLLREAVGILEKAPSPQDSKIAQARSALGACLVGLQRFDDAETALLQSQAVLDSAPTVTPTVKIQALRRLLRLYEQWGKGDKAEEIRGRIAEFERPPNLP